MLTGAKQATGMYPVVQMGTDVNCSRQPSKGEGAAPWPFAATWEEDSCAAKSPRV